MSDSLIHEVSTSIRLALVVWDQDQDFQWWADHWLDGSVRSVSAARKALSAQDMGRVCDKLYTASYSAAQYAMLAALATVSWEETADKPWLLEEHHAAEKSIRGYLATCRAAALAAVDRMAPDRISAKLPPSLRGQHAYGEISSREAITLLYPPLEPEAE